MHPDHRLNSGSPTSSLSTDSQSMHTVASSFASIGDKDSEQIDPFMFGHSPRTLAFPSPHPPTPPELEVSECFDCSAQRSPIRPIIHIRSRSWGVHQMASPPPRTPLPPIPADVSENPLNSLTLGNSLTTPLVEIAPLVPSLHVPSRPVIAVSHSNRLITLGEIAEEDGSTNGSSVLLRSSFDTDRARSQSTSSAEGKRLDSFINFDHSSVGSGNDSNDSEHEERLPEAPDLLPARSKYGLKLVVPITTKASNSSPVSPLTPRRLRKLSKVHKGAHSTIEADRLPNFRRGSSAESISSNEELITPKDALDQPSIIGRSHKRSMSWTKFKDRLKGFGAD